MSLEQFWLRWNNQADILGALGQLLTNEAFVDVTLFAEGRVLKAHKIILSACSPFFESVFNSLPNLHSAVVLKDVKFNSLKALMDFVYRGEVFVDQNDISDVLKAAEALKIKGLVDVVWNETTPFNVVHVVTPKECAKTGTMLSGKRRKSGSGSPKSNSGDSPTQEQVECTEEVLTEEVEMKSRDDLIMISESVTTEEQNTEKEELTEVEQKESMYAHKVIPVSMTTAASVNDKSTIMIIESPAVSVSSVPTVAKVDVRQRHQRQYTKEDMKHALELVRQGQMGIKPAARAFNIPVATLHHAARRSKIISPLQQGGRNSLLKRNNLGEIYTEPRIIAESKIFTEPRIFVEAKAFPEQSGSVHVQQEFVTPE